MLRGEKLLQRGNVNVYVGEPLETLEESAVVSNAELTQHINKQLLKLSNTVAGVCTVFSSLKEDVHDMHTHVNAACKDIARLEANLSNLSEKVSKLDASTTKNQDLTTQVALNSKAIKDMDGILSKVVVMEEKVTDLDTYVENVSKVEMQNKQTRHGLYVALVTSLLSFLTVISKLLAGS